MERVPKILAVIAVVIVGVVAFYVTATIKNGRLAGGSVYQIDLGSLEYTKARELIQDMDNMGLPKYSAQLMDLLDDGCIWIAPRLRGRQGLFIDTFGIKRIYINKKALMNPVSFLDTIRFVDIELDYMKAFGYLTLSGTIFHEYIHYSGELDENRTYSREIDFYKQVNSSVFYTQLSENEQAAYDWAIESAVNSAIKARQLETAHQ